MEAEEGVELKKRGDRDPTQAERNRGAAFDRAGPEERPQLSLARHQASEPVGHRKEGEAHATEPHRGRSAARAGVEEILERATPARRAHRREPEPRTDHRLEPRE